MAQDYFPTKHLLEKLSARNVTWAEIVDIVEHPDVVYGPDIQGRRTLQRGELCVIVGKDNAVLTVLLRNADQWDDDQARDRKKR